MWTVRLAATLLALTFLSTCSNSNSDWDNNYSAMPSGAELLPIND